MDLDFSKLDALYSRQARAKRETEPPPGEMEPPLGEAELLVSSFALLPCIRSSEIIRRFLSEP